MTKVSTLLKRLTMSLALLCTLGVGAVSVRADAGGAPYIQNVTYTWVGQTTYIRTVHLSNGDSYSQVVSY